MDKVGYSVRKVDSLGRVVIPIEIRRELSIDDTVPLEIFKYGDGVFIKKYEPIIKCSLCGTTEKLTSVEGLNIICQSCIEKIKKIK